MNRKPYHVSWCQVDWSDDAQDPADYMEAMEFDTIEEARAFAISTSENWDSAELSKYAPVWADGYLVPEWELLETYVDGVRS